MIFSRNLVQILSIFRRYAENNYCLFVIVLSGEPRQNQGRGLVDRKLVQALPVISLLAVPRRLFCFGFFVILDVARCYLWLVSLYINIEIGKTSCLMLD